MNIDYKQVHPVSGIWPEWPGGLNLTYDSNEDLELKELSFSAPDEFVGYAKCGIIHPLPLEWIWFLRRRPQLFYCRGCAAEVWDYIPQKRWELSRKKCFRLSPIGSGANGYQTSNLSISSGTGNE
jgi:hypothetical protein